MAKCISKACSIVFGSKHILMYCFFHLKENFLKNNYFKPSIELWKCFEDFCRSEILFEDFQKKWIDEESAVDSKCKGFAYLMKKSLHFMPHKEFPCHRRGISSSQRIEMTHSCLKRHGSKAIEMLRQAFIVATNWFNEGAIIKYNKNQIVIYKAQEIIDEMFLRGAKGEYRNNYHIVHNNKCCCCIHEDIGIPCPAMSLEIIKNCNKISSYLSNEWLVETHQIAFKKEKPSVETICYSRIERNPYCNQTSELVVAKLKWIYENSPEYKLKIDSLIEDASTDIQIPFFEISNQNKKKHTKRYKSSIEEIKTRSTMESKILKYMPDGKIILKNIVAFASTLCETNSILPKFCQSWKKIEMLNWFQKNWNEISKSLS